VKRFKSPQKQNTSIDKQIILILYKDTGAIWGMFSSELKALRAIQRNRLNPAEIEYMVYQLDYRYMNARAAYVSDNEFSTLTSLADLSSVPIVRRNNAADFGSLADLDNVSDSPRWHSLDDA